MIWLLLAMWLIAAPSSAFTMVAVSSSINDKSPAKPAASTTALCMSDSMAGSGSYNARKLLYEDQQQAMLDRSLVEHELLKPVTSLLEAPMLMAKAECGTGFGGGRRSSSGNNNAKSVLLAAQQAKVVQRDGVLRIDNALSPHLADKLREYILQQQELALKATEKDPAKARSFFGVEQARKHRCDLQLSLLRGGYEADNNNGGVENNNDHNDDKSFVLGDALQALLGEQGSLRHVYEKLVTSQGGFYELAAVITHPGSLRQTIHPDLPYQNPAPLYVIFVALQDISEDMGPTSFLLKAHTKEQNAQYFSREVEVKDSLLSNSDCRLSVLPKGSAVLFDARILHCGNANTSDKVRALFNFSFRNPKVTGNLGYDGSIRPGYCGAMTLKDVSDALKCYQEGNREPFAKYGDGLL